MCGYFFHNSKNIIKIINLEMMLRATLSNNFNYLRDIVTNRGLKEFKLTL